jgi:hypothetical protein
MCRRGPRSLLHVKEGACLLMGDSRARLVSFPSFKGGGGGLPAAGELVGLSLFFQLPVAFLLPGNWWACPFSSLFFRLPVAFLLLGNWWACPFSSNCRWPSCCWGTRGPVPFLPRRAPK